MSSTDSEGADLALNLGKIYNLYACMLLAFIVMLALAEELGTPRGTVAALIIAAPLLATVIAGLMSRTSNTEHFFAAGRIVPPFCNGLAIAAAGLPAVWFLVLPGLVYQMGYDGLAFPLGLLFGLLIGLVLIVPYIRKSGAATVPEFLGLRYGAGVRVLAALVILAAFLPLLAAALQSASSTAAGVLGLDASLAVAAMAAILLLTVVPGGMKGATWAGVGQGMVLITACLIPIAYWGAKTHGWLPAQLGYGAALPEISSLELTLIEKKLADVQTFKPHLKPFLQLDQMGFLAILLAVAFAAASMPHILQRSLTSRSVSAARFSHAWAALLLLLVLVSAPAVAALAKLEIYALIARPVPMAELPAWMAAPSRQGALSVHGVSLKLAGETVEALRAGAQDPAAVGRHMSDRPVAVREAWGALKDPVRAALVEGAKVLQANQAGDPWEVFRASVLPPVAAAAGNKTGLLTQAGLAVTPGAVMMMVPGMAEMPETVGALIPAGEITAALALAAALLVAMSSAIGGDLLAPLGGSGAPVQRRLWTSRVLMVILLGAAAALALESPPALADAAHWSASLIAAALFPALVLGIWSKRANGWGALAAMLVAAGLCVLYLIGTRFFAVEFYTASPQLSNASESAARRFGDLMTQWAAANSDTKAALWASLEDLARGTAIKPGLANWFGLPAAAAAAAAVPIGFGVLMIVSRLTPAPSAARQAFAGALRKPGGPLPAAEAASGRPVAGASA